MLKHLIKLVCLLVIPISAFNQIPNPSFEDWSNSLPDDWFTNSTPPDLIPVCSSTDAHAGSYALKCEIVDDHGVAFGPFLQPVSSNYGFPIMQNHSTLYGWYKSGPVGTNLGLIEAWAYDAAGNQIGVGITYLAS